MTYTAGKKHTWPDAATHLATRLERMPDLEIELSAPAYLEAAQELAELSELPGTPAYLRAGVLSELGNALRTNGDFTAAADTLHKALETAGLLSDGPDRDVLMGMTHLRMAAALEVVDSIVAGFEHLDRATSYFEAAGNEVGLARCAMSRGTLHARIDNFVEAEESLKQALEHYRQSGEDERYGIVLSNLSVVLRLMGRPAAAVAAGREAMGYARNLRLRTTSAGNLTFALADLGELDEAMQMAEKTRVLIEEIGMPVYTIEYKRALAAILMKQARPAEARDCLLQALDVAQRMGFVRDMTECHGLIASAYRDLGDYSNAFEHLEKYHQQLLARSRKTAASQLEVQKWRLQLDAARIQAEQERLHREQLARSLAELNTTHAQLSARAVELEWNNHRDSLTELANRRYFDERLADYASRSANTGAEVALLLIDLDRFKSINDRFGHPVGDEVLRRTGRILQSMTRSSDLTARIGGEEFGVLLTNMTADMMHRLAEEIRRAFAAHDWDSIEPGIRVTISIGGAAISEADHDPLKLFELADRRLYQAKRAGRNKVVSKLTGTSHTG